MVGAELVKNLDFEYDFIKVQEGDLLEQNTKEYPVAIIHSDPYSTTYLSILLQKINPKSQVIFVGKLPSTETIVNLYNIFPFFRWISSFKNIKETIPYALENYNFLEQDIELEKMVHFQNSKLESLKQNLEDHVQKRQQNLIKTKKRLQNTFLKIDTMHKALIAVHQAHSKPEMERLLVEVLSNSIPMENIKILDRGDLDIFDSSLEVKLVSNETEIGSVHYFIKKKANLSKVEKSFLWQISDTIALALERLQRLDESVAIEKQWSTTFNAITHPVAIINENFEITKGNKALQSLLANKTFAKNTENKCYQVLFQRESKCNNCELGKSFSFTDSKNGVCSDYQVFSQPLRKTKEGNKHFLHIYQNITDKNKAEKQILESAKMAELGIIGSSIAHELNNPLAGIISFLQLITLDMKDENPAKNDIKAMENAALRCKDIIQNLLSFTRKTNSDNRQNIELGQVIQRAVHITNLQAKSLGILLQCDFKVKNARVFADFNILSQALICILQNSIEAIIERMKQVPKYPGKVLIELDKKEKIFLIKITDNGIGIKHSDLAKVFTPLYTTKNQSFNRGLGLTISYQILQELKGSIELFEQDSGGVQVKISLPENFSDS